MKNKYFFEDEWKIDSNLILNPLPTSPDKSVCEAVENFS